MDSEHNLDDIPLNSNHESTLENDLPIVHFISFGRRRGPLVPTPNLSIDLRDMPNPPKALRNGQTGLSKPIRDWVSTNPGVQSRFQRVCRQVRTYLDTTKEEGITEVVVGVNCEIGKHRSVAFVEELGRTRFDGWNVVTGHRDVHLKRSSQKHRSHRERGDEDD